MRLPLIRGTIELFSAECDCKLEQHSESAVQTSAI